VIVAGITGILNPLEHLMKSILDFLHTSVGLPWGWAIVVLTIMVRIVLVPLTVRQIHSMQSLQAHAPQMKEIQKKYKGDRQKLNEELMKFYKENNINPAASCLPLAAQFPVFIALYLTLKHYAHHIHGSWLHVVPNISAKASSHWSGWLLLCIYAGSQVASTYFMGATMDKTQRRIMMVLPLAFLSVVSRFPVGLTLYWMTTNLWTVGQGLITRRLVPRTPAPGTGGSGGSGGTRSSRTPPKNDGGSNGSGGAGTENTPSPQPKPAQPKQQARVQRRKRGGARR
jgi:YidC/Oxa1 family membrane protein insertase